MPFKPWGFEKSCCTIIHHRLVCIHNRWIEIEGPYVCNVEDILLVRHQVAYRNLEFIHPVRITVLHHLCHFV